MALERFDSNQILENYKRHLQEVGPTRNSRANAIACAETVELSGIEGDYQLNFNEQVSRICQKVAKQLNTLQNDSQIPFRRNQTACI